MSINELTNLISDLKSKRAAVIRGGWRIVGFVFGRRRDRHNARSAPAAMKTPQRRRLTRP